MVPAHHGALNHTLQCTVLWCFTRVHCILVLWQCTVRWCSKHHGDLNDTLQCTVLWCFTRVHCILVLWQCTVRWCSKHHVVIWTIHCSALHSGVCQQTKWNWITWTYILERPQWNAKWKNACLFRAI